MTRRRRGAVRAAAQAATTGRNIQQAREVNGLTLSDASRRAGMAKSTWERIEGGQPTVTLANLVAAADSVGLDLVCQTYPGRELSLRDSGQLGIAHRLRQLANEPWRMTLEEQAGDHGEAIDQVFWSADEILAVEIDRFLVNWQSQFRRWNLKRDWLAARHPQPVRLVIVVSDTRRNREAIAPYAPTLSEVLPAGTRAVYSALQNGTPLGSDGLCWIRAR